MLQAFDLNWANKLRIYVVNIYNNVFSQRCKLLFEGLFSLIGSLSVGESQGGRPLNRKLAGDFNAKLGVLPTFSSAIFNPVKSFLSRPKGRAPCQAKSWFDNKCSVANDNPRKAIKQIPRNQILITALRKENALVLKKKENWQSRMRGGRR